MKLVKIQKPSVNTNNTNNKGKTFSNVLKVTVT